MTDLLPTPANPGDDPDLVAAAQAGDRDALEQLLRLHQPKVHAICRRITGNDADALDATQEALVAIVSGIGRFDGRSRLSTWVYRVATNACLDELRRRSRRPIVGLADDDPDAGRPEPVASARPADEAAARVDVDRALETVRPEFRVAVVLRDLCGLDYAEIADVLDLPPGTVRSRIARGRAALADALGNQDPAPERPRPRP
jgi:RNA polymerase sigma-70 factor (ECF subfamily)